jgi:hypothetical protein
MGAFYTQESKKASPRKKEASIKRSLKRNTSKATSSVTSQFNNMSRIQQQIDNRKSKISIQ